MKTEPIARVVAVAFLAFGLSVAGYGLRHHRAAKKELASLGEKQARLNAEIKQTKEKIEVGDRERRRLQAALQKSQPESGKKAGLAQRDPTTALLASHPKLLDLFLKNFRAGLNRRFGVFYHLAGLSPEQIAKFEDLTTKHQADAIDLAATAAAQGLDNADPALAALRSQQNDQIRAGQIAILGDAGYQQLQQFNRAQRALDLVNGAAQLALAPADAYTYAQAAQLMQIVANASPPYRQGGVFDPNSVDWDSVEAQATAMVSPAQLDALKAQAQAMRLMTQLLPSYVAQQSGK